MKEIGAGSCDVVHPNKHMEMNSPALLKLKSIKVHKDVLLAGMVGVAKDLSSPAVVVCTREVPAHNLLQDVGDVNLLQGRDISHIFTITASYILQKWRKGKGPFIWADN